MSERTTIGGVVYESIGSSSSNLLLKCNGTARIQWGNKLIDLIKNGKIVSGDTSTQIFIVSDKKEIKQDGIYLINNEKSQELWICKKGEQYNLNNANLYISANTKQDITAEQQKQALCNIGFYYETIEDVKNAKIQNGLVYVLEDKTLYSINNGVIEEFEAKLKTVTVEKENKTGEFINSQYKIVLSVSGEEYVKLENKNIVISQDLSISDNVKIYSENATSDYGYRLYIKDYESWLEVDNLIVRNNKTQDDYFTEVTFSELNEYISKNELIPGHWYVITDFQNHWKLPKNHYGFNRPILIQAETNNTIYQNGYLYEDKNIKIKYDINFQDIINDISGNEITARGKIIWMKDEFNNEANFDFLDYTDYNNQPLTNLYTNSRGYDSIFPVNSSNNKVELYNLAGTIIKKSEDGKHYVDTAETITSNIVFNCKGMHDNILSGTNIFIQDSCQYFDKNIIKDVNNLTVSGNIRNCTFETITNCKFNGDINQITFKDLIDCTFGEIVNCKFDGNITYCTFGTLTNCKFTGSLNDVTLGNTTDCTFGTIETCEFNGTLNQSIFKDLSECQFKGNIDQSIFKYLTDCQFETIINCTFNRNLNDVIFKNVTNSVFGTITNCRFTENLNRVVFKDLSNCQFGTITDCKFYGNLNQTVFKYANNCIFGKIENCTFNGNINQSTFKDLTNCTFELGDIINLDCLSNLDGFTFSSEEYPIIYDQLKYKEMYMQNDVLHIVCPLEHLFHRGMIMMHSGIEAIPEGWAICDGKEYEYNGFKTTTPNLINKFIKAVSSVNDIKEVNNPNLNFNNEFTLQEKHLPAHSHPHVEHTHSISGTQATIQNSESLSMTLEDEYISNISTTTKKVVTDVSGENITTTNKDVINSISIETAGGNTSGGVHTHGITITEGTISKTTSTEQTKTWTNEAFKIEPNYYSLIFIMKL